MEGTNDQDMEELMEDLDEGTSEDEEAGSKLTLLQIIVIIIVVVLLAALVINTLGYFNVKSYGP